LIIDWRRGEGEKGRRGEKGTGDAWRILAKRGTLDVCRL